MDYHRNFTEEHHPSVELALIMLPGRNHRETGKFSVSPLILNPGGPGGSGIGLMLTYAVKIQQVVGLDQDVVSFDPRGVGWTKPLADCYSFPSGKGGKLTIEDQRQGWFKRMAWEIQGEAVGIVNATEGVLKKLDERARTHAEMCRVTAERDGEDSILRHLSTPAVATDMISIIDAWDTWRADTTQDIDDILAEDDKLSTKGQLVYWGFSYGTLLGATFASMFPERVGRVILDAVVDAEIYVSPSWDFSLDDTDACEAAFWIFCHQAGTDCALYRTGDTQDDVKDRYHSILDSLRASPVKGINSNFMNPSIVTHDDIRMLVFRATYSPTKAFPPLAILLNYHFTQKYQFLVDSIPHLANIATYTPFLDPHTLPLEWRPQDANHAITCSDKRYPLNATVAELQSRFEDLSKKSTWADVWTTFTIACDGWAVQATDPPMRWDPYPPSSLAIASGREEPIKTSFPLLFLSNTADPVTPLSAGVKMAGKFKNAGLVQVDIEGHSTLAQVSECAIRRIRGYLGEGKVPAFENKKGGWEVCARSEVPWKPFQGMDDEDGMGEMDVAMEGWSSLKGAVEGFGVGGNERMRWAGEVLRGIERDMGTCGI